MTNTENKEIKKSKKKKKKKLKNAIYNVLLVVLLCICAFSGYQIIKIYVNNANAKKVQTETSLRVIPEVSAAPEVETQYETMFNETLAQNDDFIGWLVFDSGLLNVTVVQGETNDSYLRRNFYKQYDVNGTIFQDAQQDLNGTNITIYGHYIYSDASLMFSPLEQLKNQANYEANKTFHLYLENEVRDYTVCAVADYDTRTQNVHYEYGNFDEASWNGFYDLMVNRSLYNTGVTVTSADHFVTLQTCERTDSNRRTLVFGVETGRRTISQDAPVAVG